MVRKRTCAFCCMQYLDPCIDIITQNNSLKRELPGYHAVSGQFSLEAVKSLYKKLRSKKKKNMKQ
jgi:hypothetical protein